MAFAFSFKLSEMLVEYSLFCAFNVSDTNKILIVLFFHFHFWVSIIITK
jgi:hypothetical protein